jgi:hypothetical protein
MLSFVRGGLRGTLEDNGTAFSPWDFQDIESDPWEMSRASRVAYCGAGQEGR